MDRRSRFRASQRLVPIGLLIGVFAVLAIAAPTASAYIYVSGPVTNWLYGPNPNPSSIERLTLDGSAVQANFIAPTRANWGIQTYGDRIYWLDFPGPRGANCDVKSASLAGADVETLATIPVWGCSSAGFALAGGYLYWGSASGEGKIGRVSLQPPHDVNPNFIHLPLMPGSTRFDEHGETGGLATDGTWLYWMDEMRHTVGRARVDGTDVDPALFKPQPPNGNVGLFGVSRGYLYWGYNYGDGNVGRARIDGTDANPNFMTGFHTAAGALTEQWLYFTGSQCAPEVPGFDPPNMPGCVNIDGAVRRVALEPGATPELIAQGLGEGVGYAIGVDSLGGTFPKVRIAKHGNGTATAFVATPRPATVSVRGRRIVRARARDHRPKVARVGIRPRRSTKRALRRHRSAQIRVRLAYRPFKGLPRHQTRTLTLRLGRQR
jgi:hypothetical protein